MPREDDTRYNEVDFDSEDTKYNKDYDAQLRDEVAVESVVIIVLVSLLVTLLFFGEFYFFNNRIVGRFWKNQTNLAGSDLQNCQVGHV